MRTPRLSVLLAASALACSGSIGDGATDGVEAMGGGVAAPMGAGPGAAPSGATMTGGHGGSPASVPAPVGAGGSTSSPGEPGGTLADPRACANPAPLPRRVRPLSSLHYDNALKAVFGAAVHAAAAPSDPYLASDRAAAFSTNADLRRLDLEATRTLLANAEGVARAAVPSLRARFSCLAAAADDACAATVVRALGRELYRRPLTAEAQPLLALFSAARARAGVDEAIVVAVRAMLTSPRFLFRRELGAPGGGAARLSAHEIADALAFTLTGAPPDAELRTATDAGALVTAAQLRAQALRLVRAAANRKPTDATLSGPEAFLRELFDSRDFLVVQKDAKAFPGFEGARKAVLEDWNATLAATLRSESPTLRSLLLGTRQVVRPETARLMGWDVAARLPAGGESIEAPEPDRLGVLTHPMVMGNFAHESESNPVRRGHFVSGRLLCLTVPPPPDAVTFPERGDETGKTLRQVIEQSHSVAPCAGCHRLMDPLGFPLEIFDAVGRRRTTDRGLPVDPTGAIVGTADADGPVADIRALLQRLADARTVHSCVARSAFQYIVGEDADAGLACRTGAFARAFAESGGDLPSLFAEIVASPLFVERR